MPKIVCTGIPRKVKEDFFAISKFDSKAEMKKWKPSSEHREIFLSFLELFLSNKKCLLVILTVF
jgi:hypothetical protein